jgi:hypothetical protein
MMDTFNKWMLGLQGDEILVLNPPRQLTKEEALIFAAWLVILAGTMEEFNKAYEEVCNS